MKKSNQFAKNSALILDNAKYWESGGSLGSQHSML
jgi:hypothetical protein